MANFLGMRGSGSWSDDERPRSWRETILYLEPNGDVPLTAIMSKARSKKVDDPEHNYWTQSLQARRGTVTGVYTDVGLSSAYVSGGVVGQTIYCKMAEADAFHFVAGKQVLLRLSTDYRLDVVAKVVGVGRNGASSYIAAKLLEPDDNGVGKTLANADVAMVAGDMHPEGSTPPVPLMYDPVKVTQYTQIFQNSLAQTRTGMETHLRTPDQIQRARKQCLLYHGIDMEMAMLWSVPREWIGENGQKERSMRGLVSFVKEYAAANVTDYTLAAGYAGQSWIAAGEEWLDTTLEQIFRYGKTEKLALCGSGALLGINRLAKSSGQFTFTSKTTSYGIKVREWETPFGTLYLKRHPLFSYEATNRNSMLIVEPDQFVYNYITDTVYHPDDSLKKGGQENIDGIFEYYLTECDITVDYPMTMGYLNGVGLDNALA